MVMKLIHLKKIWFLSTSILIVTWYIKFFSTVDPRSTNVASPPPVVKPWNQNMNTMVVPKGIKNNNNKEIIRLVCPITSAFVLNMMRTFRHFLIPFDWERMEEEVESGGEWWMSEHWLYCENSAQLRKPLGNIIANPWSRYSRQYHHKSPSCRAAVPTSSFHHSHQTPLLKRYGLLQELHNTAEPTQKAWLHEIEGDGGKILQLKI